MIRSMLATGRGRLGLSVVLLALCGAAGAQTSPMSVYLEAGRAPHDGADTNTATVGLRVPTPATFFGGRMTLSVDTYLSQWKTHAAPGADSHFTQIGVVPMFRYKFGETKTAWFVEGGVGASYLTSDYHSTRREFSTRWNFSDHLGVGRSFGVDGRHELGLYVKHVSNAGLKEPNPGETFYMLRYAYAL